MSIRDKITTLWPQYSHWARPGRGGRRLYHETIALLQEGGYQPLGNRPAPEGAEIIYAPTGTVDRGGPGRRVRYYVGRWYRPTAEAKAEDR
jgi:hypothetical protein